MMEMNANIGMLLTTGNGTQKSEKQQFTNKEYDPMDFGRVGDSAKDTKHSSEKTNALA